MTIEYSLLKRRFWIFDLDGTITVAIHDFNAIRKELGILEGLPIVETIKSLPENESLQLKNKLNKIEEKIARKAIPAPGVRMLLENLLKKNYKLGILTLNSKENAFFTLESIGLSRFFKKDTIVGRWCAEPKPSPEGIFKILKFWKAEASEALIVGDYLYDLQVGRAAKVGTVHVDFTGEFLWPDLADIKVRSLNELSKLLIK
tara:strand:- start:188 stop:796 length:609 start_codon:yes stop_codon:yes gene_type:complete